MNNFKISKTPAIKCREKHSISPCLYQSVEAPGLLVRPCTKSLRETDSVFFLWDTSPVQRDCPWTCAHSPPTGPYTPACALQNHASQSQHYWCPCKIKNIYWAQRPSLSIWTDLFKGNLIIAQVFLPCLKLVLTRKGLPMDEIVLEIAVAQQLNLCVAEFLHRPPFCSVHDLVSDQQRTKVVFQKKNNKWQISSKHSRARWNRSIPFPEVLLWQINARPRFLRLIVLVIQVPRKSILLHQSTKFILTDLLQNNSSDEMAPLFFSETLSSLINTSAVTYAYIVGITHTYWKGSRDGADTAHLSSTVRSPMECTLLQSLLSHSHRHRIHKMQFEFACESWFRQTLSLRRRSNSWKP